MSKIIVIGRCEPWCPYSNRFNGDTEIDHSIMSRLACIKRNSYDDKWHGSYKNTSGDHTSTCFLKKLSSCEE